MHGGTNPGAPKGNKNAWKHGLRSGEYGQAFIDRLVGSIVVPTGASQVARTIDPVQRDKMDVPGVPSLLDSSASRVMSRIPGLSDTLPGRVDLWGNDITGEGGAGPDILSPLWVSHEQNDPVTAEMLRLNARFGRLEKSVDGVRLTPQQYNQYQRLSGQYIYADLADAIAHPNGRISTTTSASSGWMT